MSPTPIIDRQRALSRVGEIRTGGEKPARGAGKKLEQFRLTSQQRDIIDRCAELYGGQPKPWQSPAGDAWQLYTEAEMLPCLVVVGYSLQQSYELWEGASRWLRRCDGEHEELSDGPCICNAQGKDECSIVTRLMVVLPEAGTSLGWQLRSVGENAARELSGAMMMLDEVAMGRAFVPACLRLTQRRSTINGQVVRYVVPVLDFDPRGAVRPPTTLEEGRAANALPVGESSYAPVPTSDGPSPAEALDATHERRAKPRPGRAEPIGQKAPTPKPGGIVPTLDGEDVSSAGSPASGTGEALGGASRRDTSSPSSVGRSRRAAEGQRTKEQDDAEGRDVFGAPLALFSPPAPIDGRGDGTRSSETANARVSSPAARVPDSPPASDSPFQPPRSARKITDGQRRMLFAKAKALGLVEDQIRDAIEEVTGQRSTAEIPAEQLDAVLALIDLRGTGGG